MPLPAFCTPRLSLLLAVAAVIGGIAGVTFTRVVTWTDEANALKNSFAPVAFTFKDVNVGQYNCSAVTGCTCTQAAGGLPTCNELVTAVSKGPCAGDSCCARTVCSTCCKSCSVRSCDSSNKCSSRSTTSCSSCGSYSCNCYCADTVASQSCDVAKGNCWKPQKTASWADATRSRTFNGQCGFNDVGCLNEFMAGWVNGGVMLGYAPKNGRTEPLYFTRDVNWDSEVDPSGRTIAGITLSSISLSLGFFVAVAVCLCCRDKLYNGSSSSSSPGYTPSQPVFQPATSPETDVSKLVSEPHEGHMHSVTGEEPPPAGHVSHVEMTQHHYPVHSDASAGNVPDKSEVQTSAGYPTAGGLAPYPLGAPDGYPVAAPSTGAAGYPTGPAYPTEPAAGYPAGPAYPAEPAFPVYPAAAAAEPGAYSAAALPGAYPAYPGYPGAEPQSQPIPTSYGYPAASAVPYPEVGVLSGQLSFPTADAQQYPAPTAYPQPTASSYPTAFPVPDAVPVPQPTADAPHQHHPNHQL